MVGIRWSHSLTIIYYRNTIKNKCVISSRLWETLDAAEVDVKSQKRTGGESRSVRGRQCIRRGPRGCTWNAAHAQARTALGSAPCGDRDFTRAGPGARQVARE